AEALGELRDDHVTQGHIVQDGHQLDVPARRRGRDAHRHVVGDHPDLALEVDAPGFVGELYLFAGTDERVRATLVHQWIGPEARRHLDAARLAHKLDMHDVGRTVGPFVGTWQW